MKVPVVELPIQIRFNDTDLLGHINASSYYEYFMLGRTDLIARIEKETESVNTVLASANITYLSEVRFEQEVIIKTWASNVGNKSITISHELYADGKLSATCQATLVGFDTQTRKSCKLPDSWEPSETN